ncbi:MAG: fused MFS/spermidine synthase [Desulfobacterales bacterium]|nr:fused MFS/spermidine synthase [Pseudomonadota bacterium]MCG2773781.1 fused MFS/spermidine synthase [Desulfobacterales bacterium]
MRITRLQGVVLVYGAGAMISQVLILRELMVLAQGQELKLALGLWAWLLWAGLGSLAGGRRGAPGAPETAPGRLGGLLALLGLLLPLTILAARSLPSLAHLPLGQSLPLSTTFLLFVLLLAPVGLVSGYFFPGAVQVLAAGAPQRAAGRAYYLETLGAAGGVLLLQLFLIGRYANLSLGLAMGLGLALAPWFLARPRSLAARVALALNLLVLAAAVLFAPRLEVASRGWEWPGRQVIATVDSPYALLSVQRQAEQISFFANNLWQFTYPDPLTAEHQVQLGLLQHPQPRRVLLLGGGVAGLGAEILKTRTVTSLTYVELDPYLVRLAQGLLPAAADLSQDPRVQIIYQDARRFLETTDHRYDVILLALPEPKNAQLNRFYTREFYRIVAGKLLPGGVFSFGLPGTETSFSPLRAAYLAMAYHTLGQVFPEVAAFPGGQVRFFASTGSGVLVSDPEVLVRRLKIRQLQLQYVREYYLLQDLSPWRRQYLDQVLRQPAPAVNTDLTPRCYFFDLVLSTVQEGLGVKEALLAVGKLPPAVPWAALALATGLAGVALRRRPGPSCLYQVGVMGLGTMAMEILGLVLYQIRLGSLYQQLGLLIAAFMAGMAAGSAAVSHWADGPRGGPRLLAGLQGGLAVLAASMALWLSGGASIGASGSEFWTRAGYVLMLAAAGFGGGGIFAASAAIWHEIRPEARAQGGRLYAADLLGATLGTLGVSLLVLPVWGIVAALWMVAFLHAGAGLMALLSPKS